MKPNNSVIKQIAKTKKTKVSFDKDESELLHELRVRQVELEAQNEDLRTMQHQLESVRDQYTDLFDFAPVGYFILDKNGIIINANLTGSGLLNSQRGFVKGKPFITFLSNSKDSTLFFNHLREVYKTETLHSCVLLLKRKGSANFFAQIETISEINEKTDETQFRLVISDITEKKKTEELLLLNEELRIEKEKAQQYLQLSGVFFMTLNTDGIITMINQVGCKILNHDCIIKDNKCKANENVHCSLEGLNWFDNFIPKENRNFAKKEFAQQIQGEKQKVGKSNKYVVTRTGEKRLIVWNTIVLKDYKGNVIGMLKSGEDITEKVFSENALIDSELRLQLAINSGQLGVWDWDVTNNNMLWNDRMYELYDIKNHSIFNTVEIWSNALHPDDKQRVLDECNDALNGKKEFNTSFRIVKSSGKILFIKAETKAIKDDKGKVVRMVGINSDITEHINFERLLSEKNAVLFDSKQKLENVNQILEQKVKERTYELNNSQRLYKLIARNFPNGVINVFDKNLNYVFVEGMEMFNKGVEGEILIGTSFLKRVNPLIRKELQDNLMNVFNGHNISFESKIEGKTYMINAVGLHDVDDKISQILMVTQNITKLKKAENQTKQALEKERQLNELKTRFVSIASHEFRTPLTTIMNSVNLLSKHIGNDEATEKQHKHIVRVKKSVHTLTNILNDFLSLDKLDGDNIEVQMSDFNLTQFFHEIIDSLEVITKKGQKIIFNFSGEGNVTADKQALTNIFNNLLSNAIKYSGENTKIELIVNVDDEILSTSIKDEGIGILKEDKNKIFERFFRTKDALNIQGTGLGLNIVKKYIEISNGIIDFESRYRRGTIFYVKLPIKINSLPVGNS